MVNFNKKSVYFWACEFKIGNELHKSYGSTGKIKINNQDQLIKKQEEIIKMIVKETDNLKEENFVFTAFNKV